MISLDLETDLIDRANLAPAPVCASFKRTGESAGFDLMPEAIEKIRGWLAGDERIVGANIAYDLAVLGEHYPDLLPAIFAALERGIVWDVALNQKLIDIATRGETFGSYSLEALAERHGLPKPDKSGPWRLEFSRLRGVPKAHWPEGAVSYVLADAELPLAITERHLDTDRQWAERSGGRGGILHLAGFEAAKAFACHLISCWGLRTDGARVDALRERTEIMLRRAKRKLVKRGLVREDGTRDMKRVHAFVSDVFTKAGKPVPRTPPSAKFPDGQVACDKDECKASGSLTLAVYTQYVQAGTLRARVEDLAQGVDMPLQTRFNTLLETSRTSTSKPRAPLVGVQAQNFPRKAGARECLVPRPGHVFVVCDLPSAELRSLSQVTLDLFGQSRMAEQLNAGRDLHTWFGAQVLGISYESAVERSKDKEVKNARQQAKPCNFGFPGGMGAERFAEFAFASYGIRFTPARAAELKGIWLHAFPEMRAFFEYIGRLVGDRDHALVQHLRSKRWRARVPYCTACNTQFQELTANAAVSGLIEVQRQAYTVRSSALWDSRTVLYTHDEIVLETPEEMGHDAGVALSQVMAERFTQWHPDVPALAWREKTKDPRVIQPAIGRFYSKEIEQVFDGSGRLVPWEG